VKTLLFINPLKPGKLNAYKAFASEITGPRRVEFIDLLNGYGISVKAIGIDLSDRHMIFKLAEKASDIDILINNAGAIPGGDLKVLS